MNVAIVGSGYVGLVTGACLAESGHSVRNIDMDPAKVARIAQGQSPIHEPGLSALLTRNAGRRLTATTNLPEAVADAQLVMICVGTPFDGVRKDLTQVKAAARGIGQALQGRHGAAPTVVVKSTVPPGTTDDVVTPLLEAESGGKAGEDFGVGMNPEFLREGQAVEDFMNPDRLVFGAGDGLAAEALEELYAAFPDTHRVRVTNRTAETVKYASNALFATLISFSNEIGRLCSKMEGVDVVDVLRGVHLDRRLSPILEDGSRLTPGVATYLEAGCGYGGSCFPKDVRGLVAHGREAGVEMRLLDAVTRTNDRQPAELVRLLRERIPSLADLEVAVLGLDFKPGTDDMRESPAIPIIHELLAEGAFVRAYDPAARDQARAHFAGGRIRVVDTLNEALTDVEAVLLVTGWPEFQRLPEHLAARDEAPLVVDGRRMFDPTSLPRYEGIGLAAGRGAPVVVPQS